jgi:DNA-binding MarR family transcriptional regulator
MNITEKENKLLLSFHQGMDQPNCGWLHEMADETHETAGILSSLVKKGLATSFQEHDLGGCYWIEVTEKGQEIAKQIKNS